MKFRKWISGSMAAVLCSGLLPVQALAQSPEFAYSAEKWATLRDNKLEYDEIADLVHEYNSTVLQNEISWKDEKDDDNDDVAQDYYDAANDIYGNINYPDSDDSNYGSQVAAALSSEMQADRLMEQGDESVEDNETIRLGYDQTEDQLVKQAQELMISYWSAYYSMNSLEQTKLLAETSYQSEQLRLTAGLSTQSSVLTAREAVSTAEASILSAKTNLESTKENLCLMLGWAYGADVEIGELPEPDLEAIDAIDLEADIQTALENNYSLKLTAKRLANARTTTVRETQQQTQKNQKEAVSNDVKSCYDSLILARSNYQQALSAYELEKNSLDTASRKLSAGTITANDYQTRQSACLTAEVSVRTKKLDLLTAMVDYQWAVNGLASAS